MSLKMSRESVYIYTTESALGNMQHRLSLAGYLGLGGAASVLLHRGFGCTLFVDRYLHVLVLDLLHVDMGLAPRNSDGFSPNKTP